MRRINFYRKMKNRLFYICVRKVHFIAMLFVITILASYILAHNTYIGKYLETEGKVLVTSYSDIEIQVTVAADRIPDIVKENNIRWYVSADDIRYGAIIKEMKYAENGTCNLILQSKGCLEDNLRLSVKKVKVILRYGRKYVL